MAKNISLLGADYPDVPAVQLPQTGGGAATFYDIQVVDSLNSTSTTDALSANQGEVLNDKMKNNQDITSGLSFHASLGTDKQYTKCYKNEGTNIVFVNIYFTPTANLTGQDVVISGLPGVIYGSMNVALTDYYPGAITHKCGIVDDAGNMKIREGVTSGHTILGEFMYMTA